MSFINEDIEDALKQYIVLLDAERYFEAHEILEEVWYPRRLNKDPLANLLKGLINGAVAFEHLKRNCKNAVEKARKVMVAYDRYKVLCIGKIRYALFFRVACEKIEELKNEHPEVW